jgi:hypothetical protein
MLADSKWIKDVIGKEVENRDFELYTYVEHNRTLVYTQASAILSFIQGKNMIINKIIYFSFSFFSQKIGSMVQMIIIHIHVLYHVQVQI